MSGVVGVEERKVCWKARSAVREPGGKTGGRLEVASYCRCRRMTNNVCDGMN